MESRASTKEDWLSVQNELHHRQIVAVNQASTLAPSLYFGTRRCTYSDVVSVVTTVKPLPRFVHDATRSPARVGAKKPVAKTAWEASSLKQSVERGAEPPPFVAPGNGAEQYVHAPLEGDSERDKRFLVHQAYALKQERTAYLAELHVLRRKRYLVEHSAALVIQRVYRGFLLRRRFMTIKEKLRVRKRIRLNLVKVTKGTAIITGEKERKARLLERQHDAARRVQFAFRRWRGRRVLQRERMLQTQELRYKNAMLIQRQWRRAVASAVARKLRERLALQQRLHLARTLTRLYRGYRARQCVRRIRLRRETRASQCIQDAVRRFHARKALVLQRHRRRCELQHRAARTIQKIARGMLARARVDRLRVAEDRAIRVACVLLIQRVYRGFCGRQRVRFHRVFRVYALATQCGLQLTRIVRGFLGRQRAKYERLEQETDLLVQIRRGNTSTVIDLLDGYGLVDEPVELTTTNFTTKNHALHVACRHGHMAILTHVLPKFLAQAPHLVYAPNAKHETPLELAITHGHEQLASFLLTKTPELFVQATWLHARKVGATRRRERSLILDAARFGMGTIVLKLTVLFPQLFTGKERDSWSQCTLLHEALLFPRTHYEDAKTASLHGETIHVTLHTVLSKLAVDVNAPDLVGFTPLHLAAMLGNLKAVQALLEFGADVTIKDCEGRTAYRLALLHGHEACFLEIRRKWLGDGAFGSSSQQPESSDEDMARALAKAAPRGPRGLSRRRRVAHNLQPHLAGALLQAARNREIDRVVFLLEECHANVNACDPIGDGDSLLMVALHDKNTQLLRYLLTIFDDELDLAYVNKTGRSVMDTALQSPLMMKMLIHEGHANPWLPLDNVKQHRTACHEAVRRAYDLRAWLRGYKFMPSMLVPLVDDAGRTPLHDAAAFGNIAAGTLLLNAGLRVDARDAADGRTPLHDACRSGCVALVRKMVRVCPEALWIRDAAGQLPIWEAAAHTDLGLLRELMENMRPGLTERNDAFLALEKLLETAANEYDSGNGSLELGTIIQCAFAQRPHMWEKRGMRQLSNGHSTSCDEPETVED